MKKNPRKKNGFVTTKREKINPLASENWVSESSVRSAAKLAAPADSSGSGGASLALEADPGILCCGAGKTIKLKATATGPGAQKPKVTLTCPDGVFTGNGTVRHTYQVKEQDCGTVLLFKASGAGLEREAKVPVIKLTTRTVFTVPENTERKKLGVCEDVRITVTPAIGTVEWFVDGKGTLHGDNDHQKTFSAPDRASSTTIEATMITTPQETIVEKIIGCSVEFSIVEPNGVVMGQYPGSEDYHHHLWGSAGFCAEIHLAPEDVCFANLGVREGEAVAQASGYFAYLNGKVHPIGKWLPVIQGTNEHPSLVDGWDTVRIFNQSQDYETGFCSFLIPWEYTASVLNPVEFTVLDALSTSDDDGTVTTSKGGYKVIKRANAPTTGEDCPPQP